MFYSFSQRFTQQYIIVLIGAALIGSTLIVLSRLYSQALQPQPSRVVSQTIQLPNDSFTNPYDIRRHGDQSLDYLQDQYVTDQGTSQLRQEQHRLHKRAKIDATWRQIRMFVEDPNGLGQDFLLRSINAIFSFVSSFEDIVGQVLLIEQVHDELIELRDAENTQPSLSARLIAYTLNEFATALNDVPPTLIEYTHGLVQTISGVTGSWQELRTMVRYLFGINDVTVNEIDDDSIIELIKIFQDLGQDIRGWIKGVIETAQYTETIITQLDPQGQTARALPGIRDTIGPIALNFAGLADTADEAVKNLERFLRELVTVYLVNDEPTVPSPPAGGMDEISPGFMDGGGIFGIIERNPDDSRSGFFEELSQSGFENESNI
ncbi:hypothetical protein Dda_1112 [Drechslerella dactyloides]|uniref:Uncharacterized protein n=1 Tax=Drechslerella dactyloides TaxID=74499 RepID=A0AAD6J5J8_DREDA|nr:hypothetical protein Dda_1112 [Drechslerella dactyloides]